MTVGALPDRPQTFLGSLTNVADRLLTKHITGILGSPCENE